MPPGLYRSYLKKRILVQNDAKLMPNVVQGGHEVHPQEYSSILRT